MGFEVSAKTYAAVQIASNKIKECIDTFHRKNNAEHEDHVDDEEYYAATA